MEPFFRRLQKLLDTGHFLIHNLEERSQEGVNRRTIIIICVAGFLSAIAYLFVIRPPHNFPIDTLVSVKDGSSLESVARDMQTSGVVRSGALLRALVWAMGNSRSVRAGDYLFKKPEDIFSVARTLALGRYGLEPFRIRIHEGAMTKEMVDLFDKRLERFDGDRFLREAQSHEGYLFPDTYFFMPNATDETVIQTLRQNFDQQIATISSELASSTRTLSEIVTMASIVEREARDPKDRRMIAGVLWNRLARDMPLQVDVTFLYTIGKGTFDLTMTDLVSDSPYNTYKNKGLPPTPIGSPSLDSILAAAQPTKNNYLYYLADNTGVTHFSKTYAEHLRKKRLYLGT